VAQIWKDAQSVNHEINKKLASFPKDGINSLSKYVVIGPSLEENAGPGSQRVVGSEQYWRPTKALTWMPSGLSRAFCLLMGLYSKALL
jgi:hypothetical protein